MVSYRCGKLHTDADKISLSLDELHNSTRTIVERYRENEPRSELTFESLVQYARDEVKDNRERNLTARISERLVNITPPTRGVHCLETRETRNIYEESELENCTSWKTDRYPTEELPSTKDGEHSVRYIEHNVPARLLPYAGV